MCMEYRDGTFSENFEQSEIFARLQQEFDRDPFRLKALHVGTEDELNELKSWKPELESQDLQSQIDELKEQLKELAPTKSQFIHIPTLEEREAFEKFNKENNEHRNNSIRFL